MKHQTMNKWCGNLSNQLVMIIFVSCLSFIPNVFASSTPTFHLQHSLSKLYLAQGSSGETNESSRQAWVSPLVDAWGFDTHRYILYPAGGEYSYIMNVTNGLVLSESGENLIGHWGIIGSDSQRWKEKPPKGSDIFDNKRVFINKASGKGLTQIYGGTRNDRREAAEWSYDENLPGFI